MTEFLSDEALDAPGQDGNEGNLDEGDEVLLGPLEDCVQPAVSRNPGKGALHHPADSGREELAITAAIYAKAYPLRGRPRRGGELPKGAVIMADRRISRRRKT